MYNLVIFGAPGSGKGTQSEKLEAHFDLFHISTGELLRENVARGNELGRLIDSYISQGNLIPDDLMLRILGHELEINPDTRNGVIFDGFPRNINQARSLSKLLAQHGAQVDDVIGLEVPEDELVRRMLLRAEVSHRSDDNIDTIRNRLAVYHKQTAPLKDYYISEGKYRAINGSGDIDGIFEEIKSALSRRK